MERVDDRQVVGSGDGECVCEGVAVASVGAKVGEAFGDLSGSCQVLRVADGQGRLQGAEFHCQGFYLPVRAGWSRAAAILAIQSGRNPDQDTKRAMTAGAEV